MDVKGGYGYESRGRGKCKEVLTQDIDHIHVFQ